MTDLIDTIEQPYYVFPGELYFIVTSTFGMRWGSLHRGTDYGSPNPATLPVYGTPLRAPCRGAFTSGVEPGGAGNWIWVRSAENPRVLFKAFHLKEFLVPSGITVEAGDIIALANNTGSSTGSHHHWETWIDGVCVDGQSLYEQARTRTAPPKPIPTPEELEEQELMAVKDDIIEAFDTRVDGLKNELLRQLGVYEHDTRKVVVGGVEITLKNPITYAGWASRPYLVGIVGEPAVYDLRRIDDSPYWRLVHIAAPGTDGTDEAANLAWCALVIQTNANPDIQWFDPAQPPDQGDDALQVAALRALPGYRQGLMP